MISAATSSRVDLGWMRPEDDDGIRRLLRELAMEGDIRLAMARDPSFLEALSVEGESHEVLVGRDHASGDVVGLGTRSTKCVYVNGAAKTVGYLSGLRAHPDYRNGRDFFCAYKMMHQAHRERPIPLYLTTILEENTRAVRLLTSGRMNLPIYYDLGSFHTLCYAPRHDRGSAGRFALPGRAANSGRARRPAEPRVREANASDREAILSFLHQHGPRRQCFPAYLESDWGKPGGLLRDLDWTNMLLAEEDSNLVGCLGLWDQRGYRQAIVDGYGPRYRAARPFWNAFSPVHHRPRLPATGRVVDSRTAATVCVADDDAEIMSQLLRAALSRAADQGASQVAVGLHERDPLLSVARRIPHVSLRSRLYAVAWSEDGDPRDALDDRVPYLELGGL